MHLATSCPNSSSRPHRFHDRLRANQRIGAPNSPVHDLPCFLNGCARVTTCSSGVTYADAKVGDKEWKHSGFNPPKMTFSRP